MLTQEEQESIDFMVKELQKSMASTSSSLKYILDEAKHYADSFANDEASELKLVITEAEQRLSYLHSPAYQEDLAKEREIQDKREAIVDQEEYEKATKEQNLKVATGYGHGHLSSSGEEKRFYADYDKAYNDLDQLYKKDGRRLSIYPFEITTSFTKWNANDRRREGWVLSDKGYFLRTFKDH